MNATFDLGGPGARCSIAQVRRLAGGELGSPDRERVEAHVRGCARCQASEREIEGERQALLAAVQLPVFATGVAERLAQAATRRRDALPGFLASSWKYASVPLAASILVVSAALLLRNPSGAVPATPRELASRVKGGAGATVYVQEGAGSRALARGEKVPPGAKLLVSLQPAGHRFAAVALVDRDGVSPLYVGPATPGPLPQAFVWTGGGEARLVIDYTELPIGRGRFVQRLAEHGRTPEGTDRVDLELSR
ncbi:MAG: zf-HC2 domain-containing protein [Myxococcales bacterium]